MRAIIPLTMLSVLPAIAAGQTWSIPPEHPRLLIHRDELPALRKRCGVPTYRNAPPTSAPFAARQSAFERVRQTADHAVRAGARPGELYALALAHLVLGELGVRDKYVDRVENELRRRIGDEWRQDDSAIALDWCWDALRPDVRQAIAAALTARLQVLDKGINPLDHVVFHPRICDLAAAITVFDPRTNNRDDAATTHVRDVLATAASYLEGPFVRLWQQKGPAPSSPTNEIWAEADAVFAAEVWQTGAGGLLWPKLADSLGRSAEVPFWSYTGNASARFGFPWNDGSWAPDRPGLMPDNWAAAVPWIVATQTRSSTARWFTSEFPEAGIAGASARNEAPDKKLAWSQVLYGDASAGVALRQACPLGRHIPAGFVVMRTDWSPDAAVVMADVGQPYWRSRQHFAAGHFQILRSGRLATGSCEDVTFDATPARGGECSIDNRSGDWDSFAQATVAHNCITVADASYQQERLGRPWPARGNQRIIERDYALDDPPVGETNRVRGRLVAFETNSFYTYAATDLTLAYPGELVRSCVRHLLLINAGALFVCDHVKTARNGATVTWHLQLPERPQLNGADLPEADRIQGNANAAGIWRLRGEADWLDVRGGDGRLFVRTLLPGGAPRRAIGGPKDAMDIPRGEWAGRPYFGGSAKGYEHRLYPVLTGSAPQAWCRLGEPRSLGPQFGLRSNWGRLEVTAPDNDKEATFLHVLLPTASTTTRPAKLESKADAGSFVVTLAMTGGRCEVRWYPRKLDGAESAGRVSIFDPNTGELLFQNDLTTAVAPNKPIPGETH